MYVCIVCMYICICIYMYMYMYMYVCYIYIIPLLRRFLNKTKYNERRRR